MIICELPPLHKRKKDRSARFTNGWSGLFAQSRPLAFDQTKKHAAWVTDVLVCLLFLGVGGW